MLNMQILYLCSTDIQIWSTSANKEARRQVRTEIIRRKVCGLSYMATDYRIGTALSCLM